MLSLAFLTLATTIITGNASVDTTVTNSVSGGNAQVKTEITTEVNGQINKVESSEPGTLRVTVKDGQTTVSASTVSAEAESQPITAGVSSPAAVLKESQPPLVAYLTSLFTKVWQRLRLVFWR